MMYSSSFIINHNVSFLVLYELENKTELIATVFVFVFSAIEAQVRELQSKRKNLNREDIPKENERVGLNEVGGYDDDIYTGSESKFKGYHTSLAIDEADVSRFICYGCCCGCVCCCLRQFFTRTKNKFEENWT